MSVSFESFALLIHRLGHPPKGSSSKQAASNNDTLAPGTIFASWLAHLPRPVPAGTGKHIFRLLFPHEGSRRRYGLKETLLARELERILGLKGLLTRWDAVNWIGRHEGGTGCLGKEVELALSRRESSETPSTISLHDIDSLLDELAASSPFSQLSQQPVPRSTPEILTDVYRDAGLSPFALAVLTQIILRDLRPLLSPLPEVKHRNPTALLGIKTTAAPPQLELHDAMRRWDPRMLELYRSGVGSLDRCADMVEEMDRRAGSSISAGPVVGVNIPIPKCRKGRSIDDALSAFLDGRKAELRPELVWAETKYDGYRMQIHVEIDHRQKPRITIFSKSKRNSTLDRLNTHSIILASLGLPIDPCLPAHPVMDGRIAAAKPGKWRLRRSVVLEAEVLPYNESQREGGRGPGIEEFWWLGPAGVTAGEGSGSRQAWELGRDRHRHLCLSFFDILLLDGKSLLKETYDRRRQYLEMVVRPIEGFAFLAERTPIPLNLGKSVACDALRAAFERCCDDRQEGLVLKAAESTYVGMQWPWVKLKKDYIPNLGDCVDLVVLGAGWDIDRAREMRVDTSVFTTFYIGVLRNGDNVRARREIPHFDILFRASYGMERDQLEIYNSDIRHGRWKSKQYDKDDPLKRRLLGLSWTYKFCVGTPAPSVLFEQPLCCEVMGAGFLKLPGGLYEIRFPRLQKIYQPSDRPWTDALDSNQLVKVAHEALGYITPPAPLSPAEDSVRQAWRSSSQYTIDVPDMPTPSPSRPRPTRTQSAPSPDLWKTSPPSPFAPSPLPHQLMSPPTHPHVSDAGERLQEVLRTPERSSRQAWAPVSSHGKRLRLESPLAVPPEPSKKSRLDEDNPEEEIESWESFAEKKRGEPPTMLIESPLVPPSSLSVSPKAHGADLARHLTMSQLLPSDSQMADLVGGLTSVVRETSLPQSNSETGPTSISTPPPGRPKNKWRPGRPLSLRSRLHLAIRQLQVRS